MIFDKYINITQKQVVWDKDDVIIANGAMTENDQFFLETEVGFNIEIKESDYDHQFEAVHKLLNMASLESFIKTSEPIRISTKCIGRNDDVIPNIKMDVYAHSVTYSSTTSNQPKHDAILNEQVTRNIRWICMGARKIMDAIDSRMCFRLGLVLSRVGITSSMRAY